MDKPKLVKQLEKTGMTEKAAIIYLELLKNKGAYPSELAKTTGFKRSTIYKILLDLLSRNIVTEIDKDKKLYYQAQRPEKILLDIKKRVQEVQEQYDAAERLIALLLDIYYENKLGEQSNTQ